MSLVQKTVTVIVCDSCGDEFGWDEEGAVFGSATEALLHFADTTVWTTNGEGLHDCEACPPLELTDAAKAEAARALGPGDIPLEGITA